MAGRNEPCPCGSGKKYKKCCAGKQAVSVEEVHNEEMERILQTFFDTYPKQQDVQSYIDFADGWKTALGSDLPEEMVESIALDEFFFHERQDIWLEYIAKQRKKQIRPSMAELLDLWTEPRVFIGKVTDVEETYIRAESIADQEVIRLWKESDKPVPLNVHFYCFLLPDGTSKGNYLAVSSLIFFPADRTAAIENFAQALTGTALKEQTQQFWTALAEDGYKGDEFTQFEKGVLHYAAEFLAKHDRHSEQLLELIEDFLVAQQPRARKEVAIAAGAVRYGQEQSLFEPLPMTLKEIAETFGVSPSSMNKYAKEIAEYAERNLNQQGALV